jgi:hypothetical protein
LIVVRWMGEPEWIARPPKEGLLAKAGRTAVKVVKTVEAFVLLMGVRIGEEGGQDSFG